VCVYFQEVLILLLGCSRRMKLGQLVNVVLILTMVTGILSPVAQATQSDSRDELSSYIEDMLDLLAGPDDLEPQTNSIKIELEEIDGSAGVTETVYADAQLRKKVSLAKDGGPAD